MFLSEPIKERLLEPLVVALERQFAAKQLADGRVLASDLGGGADPQTEKERWRSVVAGGIDAFVPRLAFVSFPLLVGGIYDVTPDHQPILDAVTDDEGLWVAAGFSGHGFMLAPAHGRLIADAVLGHRDDSVLQHFSLGRFAAGGLVYETQVV